MAESRLHQVAAGGQSVWFDTLSRDLVHSGELARMMKEDAVTGVTSNPSIFQKALSQGNAYDEQIKELYAETDDVTEIFFRLALADIRDACDVLRPVHDKTPWDGFVSMEVLPSLAYDTEKTFDQARWIAQEVDRPNLLVKIPATEPGLPAIEDCIAHGTSINITLIFSLDRYKAVVEAYLRGLERLVAGGGDPSKVSSVASFFVSRVDTEADKRLEALGNTNLQGKLAIANAKLAYEHFLETFAGPRWEYLKGKGAQLQRPLWASTSTKNPAYPDTLYVDQLIGPDTVNTLPDSTIEAFADHGHVARTIDAGLAEAHETWSQLAAVGVDMGRVADKLEAEGVSSFQKSFDELLGALEAKATELRA